MSSDSESTFYYLNRSAARTPKKEISLDRDLIQCKTIVPETTCHIPVLLDEVFEWLAPAAGKILVDGTLGGGGHARRVAPQLLPGGELIGVDRDPAAIARCEQSLAGLPIKVATASYAEIPEILDELSIGAVDGILLDLGLSSDQLADQQRGFSFQSDGHLDLRFNPEEGESAAEMLSHIGEERLADIIYHYGEERYSRRIAKAIVTARRTEPIRTAAQLAELVRRCVPRSKGHAIDPATRTFQALRIAVNRELEELEQALRTLPDRLQPSGRLVIISFHSLEDRIVKHAFRADERLEILTRTPIQPSEVEVQRNPRARSAKLRVAARSK